MANNFENESFIPTGLEMVLYDDQETKHWRECTKHVIAAEPISWIRPEAAFGAVEGDGSTRKRKRCTKAEVEVEITEKEFSLQELYKYSNIDEIISCREKDGINLDPQELENNLKAWTVEKRKRQQENGKERVDKTYQHPKSKKLRSIVEVRKFIEAISSIAPFQGNKNNVAVSSQDTHRDERSRASSSREGFSL